MFRDSSGTRFQWDMRPRAVGRGGWAAPEQRWRHGRASTSGTLHEAVGSGEEQQRVGEMQGRCRNRQKQQRRQHSHTRCQATCVVACTWHLHTTTRGVFPARSLSCKTTAHGARAAPVGGQEQGPRHDFPLDRKAAETGRLEDGPRRPAQQPQRRQLALDRGGRNARERGARG